jgi:hypothetical protein
MYKTVSSETIILISDVGMPLVQEFSFILLNAKAMSYTSVQRVFILEMCQCKNVKENILMYVMFFKK